MDRDRHHEDERGRKLRDLFEDGTDEPGEPTQEASAEELRYEGPITIEPEDDEFEDGARRGAGRAFITAALIFGVVVIIVAGAMLLRGGGGSEITSLAEQAGAPAVAGTPAPGEPATGDGGTDFREIPDVGTPDGDAVAALDLPAVPDTQEVAAERAPSGPEPSAATQAPPVVAPPVERPRPVPTRDVVEPAPSEPVASGASGGPDAVRRLALAGRVREAAEAGAGWARARSGRWTLQVLLACEPETVTRAFREVPGDELIVVPREYAGRSCYALCWGDWGSRADAEAATHRVPSHFDSGGKPLARRFGDVAVR